MTWTSCARSGEQYDGPASRAERGGRTTRTCDRRASAAGRRRVRGEPESDRAVRPPQRRPGDWLSGAETDNDDVTTRAAHMGVRIRSRQPHDDDRIAELAGQLGYPGSGRDVGARLDRMRDPGAVRRLRRRARRPDRRLDRPLHLPHRRNRRPRRNQRARRRRVVPIARRRRGARVRRRGVGPRARLRHHHGPHQRDPRALAHAFYRREGYGWVKRQETFRKRLTARTRGAEE